DRRHLLVAPGQLFGVAGRRADPRRRPGPLPRQVPGPQPHRIPVVARRAVALRLLYNGAPHGASRAVLQEGTYEDTRTTFRKQSPLGRADQGTGSAIFRQTFFAAAA